MTTNSVSYNRTLFLLDNLPVLRGLDSDSVDLIATDPPFNKGVPAFKGKTKAGQNVEFKDVWNWNDDVHPGWLDDMGKEHPTLANVVMYANAAAGDDMGAFLCWMSVRVLEMHRVLKPTGSIYLHCDPTASHYLKAMMDAVFGRKQFRNEIQWMRYRGKRAAKNPRKFPAVADYVLFYAEDESSFSLPFGPLDPEYVKRVYRHDDDDGEGPYRYGGRIRDRKYYLKNSRGVPLTTWWDDIPELNGTSAEMTGYPTQKPLALYKRMIEASSNPGDIVLDPFAGCATTCVAAEQLGRRWIGIDIEEESGGGNSGAPGARGLREYGVGCDCANADGGSSANGRREARSPRADARIPEADRASDADPRSAREADNQGRPAMPGLRVGA